MLSHIKTSTISLALLYREKTTGLDFVPPGLCSMKTERWKEMISCFSYTRFGGEEFREYVMQKLKLCDNVFFSTQRKEINDLNSKNL